ncbi:MAG: glycosyltransferase [Propionibacteriaceae bacterium]|nr:glycosyltransferase [Propionibacteriaceae bacterium]
MFDFSFSILPQILMGLGLWRKGRLVLAPRGELSPGALSIKPVRKRVFLRAYRLLGRHRRVLWHASTLLEARDIWREFGRSARVLIRENETFLPVVAMPRGARKPGPCRLAFASRAVTKKGLLTALEALATVVDRVDLSVVGAFENGEYEASCHRALARLPDNVRVTLHGVLPRAALLQELRVADAMVFPTAGENFGHVIAEALSESCPVMVSDTTPWTERLARGAGYVVAPNTPERWSEAIRVFVAAGPTEWIAGSERARAAYNEWRSEDKGKHIFQLVQDDLVFNYPED